MSGSVGASEAQASGATQPRMLPLPDEAVAQAPRIFRDNESVEDIGRGQTAISVKVEHPETEHTVHVQDFERWLETTLRSPAEMILKNRLRDLLARGR
jgi:hypothetical protein